MMSARSAGLTSHYASPPDADERRRRPRKSPGDPRSYSLKFLLLKINWCIAWEVWATPSQSWFADFVPSSHFFSFFQTVDLFGNHVAQYLPYILKFASI